MYTINAVPANASLVVRGLFRSNMDGALTVPSQQLQPHHQNFHILFPTFQVPFNVLICCSRLTMSSETRPISPDSFAKAIEDLPVENLYSKAFEINNSVAHLEQSNKLLQEYSDSIKNDQTLDPDTRAGGDKDCLDAIRENEIVIERQQERVRLLKAEVERRGQRWHELDPKQNNGSINGHNGDVSADVEGDDTTAAPANAPAPSRLTDDELRQELEARLAQDTEDDNTGLHL